MQANEPEGGRPRGAAGLIAKRAGLIAADWHHSCTEARDIDRGAVLALVVEAMARCSGGRRSAHRHLDAEAIFTEHAELLRPVPPGAVTGLRDVIRRQVLLAQPAAQAITALHCTSAVLDELHRAVTQLASENLQRLAYIDELTGLPNRRTANDAVHAAVAQAVRYRHQLVAVVIDVDHLKTVNDRDGHDAGDETLRRLADAFRAGLREGDQAFRTGGDEFLVLLPETELADVASVMDRVRAAGAPSFSYGAASAPHEADTVDALLRAADQRLLAWRRQSRSAPAPVARRQRRTRSAVVAAAVVAVVGAVLSRNQLVTTADAARTAAIVGILAGGVALVASETSRELRGRVASAVLTPMIIYATASVLLQSFVPPEAPRSDRAQLSRTTSSMTATSSGRSAVAEVREAERPRTQERASEPAEIGETATPSSIVTNAPVWVATSTTTTTEPTPDTTTTTSTTTTTTTTTTTSPPSTTTSTSSPPSTTTTTPSSTSTTTTTTARRSAGDDRRDENPKRGRPEPRDDYVRTGRPIVDINVLRNDRGAEGERGALDPDSLVVVSRPEFGDVEVRPNGVVRYRSRHKYRSDTFRYRVCTRAGRCGEARVHIDRRPR